MFRTTVLYETSLPYGRKRTFQKEGGYTQQHRGIKEHDVFSDSGILFSPETE